LSLGDEDSANLRSIAQSRTEPVSRVERARILLAYREDPSFFAVGRRLGLHHQTVQRCVERAVAEGPIAALGRPRPGREPTITLEAKAWLVWLACRKAKEFGYPHELWTTRLLAGHVREYGPAWALAKRIENIGETRNDIRAQLLGRLAHGWTRCHRGEFVAARAALEQSDSVHRNTREGLPDP
jgi:transposase